MAVPTPAFTSDSLSDAGVWTISGSPSFVSNSFPSKVTAVNIMDGVNDEIERTSGAVLTNQTTGSFAAWINSSDANQPEANCIMAQEAVIPGKNQFLIRLEINGTVGAFMYENGGNDYLESKTSGTYDDGEDHLVMVTLTANGPSLKIYVDGQPAALGTDSSGTFNNFGGTATPLRAGIRSQFDDNPFDAGLLGPPTIWTEELTAAQALEYFNSESATPAISAGKKNLLLWI